MKLRIVWFGRAGAGSFEPEVETYRRRVARRWPAEDLPLRPAAGGRDRDPRRSLAAEADAARRSVPQGWRLVAMDERGTAPTSVELAEWMAGLADAAVPGVAFVIGSDLGLDPDLIAAADRRLALGPLTLSHRLVRLVLWEQLFRATDILAGGRYHRQGVQ